MHEDGLFYDIVNDSRCFQEEWPFMGCDVMQASRNGSIPRFMDQFAQNADFLNYDQVLKVLDDYIKTDMSAEYDKVTDPNFGASTAKMQSIIDGFYGQYTDALVPQTKNLFDNEQDQTTINKLIAELITAHKDNAFDDSVMTLVPEHPYDQNLMYVLTWDE